MTLPCQVVDALARHQYDAVRGVNKKFAQLRRLAELLQQLGDLSTLVPNISALIPVADINFSTYNELAAMCPALGLPSPGEASINELRAKVVGAYGNLARRVLNHPYTRMGNLQGVLNRYQSKVNLSMATATDYLACLQAACNALDTAAGLFDGVTKESVEKELSQFASGYVASAGEVLTGPLKAKNDEAKATLVQLQDLGADVKPGFAAAKAALSSGAVAEVDETDVDNSQQLRNLPYV